MPATALCTAPAYWNGAADGETVHAREGVPVNGHVATPPTLPYRQAWTIGQVRGRRRRSTAGCALRDGPYRQVHAAACRRGGGPSHAARLGQQCQGQCPPPLSACSGRIRHAPTIGRCSARTCSTPRARARCQGGMATDFPRGWSGSAAFLTTLTGTSKQGRTATAPSTHPVAIPRAAARRRAPASSTLLCKQTVKRKQTNNQTNKQPIIALAARALGNTRPPAAPGHPSLRAAPAGPCDIGWGCTTPSREQCASADVFSCSADCSGMRGGTRESASRVLCAGREWGA
jgi:hypothetical protein